MNSHHSLFLTIQSQFFLPLNDLFLAKIWTWSRRRHYNLQRTKLYLSLRSVNLKSPINFRMQNLIFSLRKLDRKHRSKLKLLKSNKNQFNQNSCFKRKNHTAAQNNDNQSPKPPSTKQPTQIPTYPGKFTEAEPEMYAWASHPLQQDPTTVI